MPAKSIKSNWILKIYYFFFTFISIGHWAIVLYPRSNIYLYYQVLMAFNPSYLINYTLCVLNATVNILNLIPLHLYIFRKRFLEPEFWQLLFALKVIFDLTNHQYEYNCIKSLYYFSNIKTSLYMTVSIVLMFFPSYVLCYRYAFQQDNILFKPTNKNPAPN